MHIDLLTLLALNDQVKPDVASPHRILTGPNSHVHNPSRYLNRLWLLEGSSHAGFVPHAFLPGNCGANTEE
jgi:hypothetical protein